MCPKADKEKEQAKRRLKTDESAHGAGFKVDPPDVGRGSFERYNKHAAAAGLGVPACQHIKS